MSEQALPAPTGATVFASPAPRTRRRRRLGVAAIVVAIAGVAAWQVAVRWPSGAAAPRYTFAAVAQGDISARVTASGTLKPVVQVEVGSQVSGRLKAIDVDFNDTVKKGQRLALIDPEVFESNVRQARAKVAAARADLARARAQALDAHAQYRRVEGLGQSGAVAAADVDTALASQRAADAAVGSAEAQVTLAQAALDQAQTNLDYTTITSPIDGVVVSRSVDVGQTVAASLQAPTLFLLAEDLRRMEVHTNVAEADVGQISAGQRVEFTVDAFPARTFTGKVKQVRYAAETVSNVVTYDAVVLVDNDDLSLRPGMTATVSFVVDEARDVLTVPVAALRYRPAGAPPKPAIYVLEGGAPRAIPVKPGLSDGTRTAVTGEGLRAGASIIVSDGRAPATPTNGSSRRQGGPPRLF